MTLIDKAEALRIVEEYEVLHDQIAALPARGVGVKDFDVEIVRGNTGGNLSLYFNDHRVAGSKPWGGGTTIHSFRVQGDEVKSSGIFAAIRNFQTVPADKDFLTTAALAPTDAAQAREAALRAGEMLRVAARYIRDHYPDGLIDYDNADCDGACVADDCEAAADALIGEGME